MAKKVTFRGKTADELKSMPLEEFVKIIPSHQRRTMERMGAKIKNFLRQFRKRKANGKKTMKTQVRDMVILPEMLDFEFLVYNGKEWMKVLPQLPMLGHRLGNYSITTKLVRHSGPGIGATRGSKSVELK